MTTTTKRANFDLSPEQDELLANLRAQLSASSTKDAVLRAVQLITLLLDEVQQGNRLFVGKSPATAVRLAIPELEARAHGQWRWLVERAQLLERVLLTHNTEDFHELHREQPGHRGIMAVFRDADPRKNMSHAQVATAIRGLETSGVTIAGDFHVLNHWR